ncbi:3',5'-bisphosphate nucleotidase [Coprinopsis cinerea okayama7|uniref:3'(2'),5'-bisphosphate nucleotidase n=1 Tax=Coprinopsis cinerea (strain Okayama-7 / 130 / ATCC MYA-4618 / FGSC 9003) TaxID=240176 RepID=D6RJR3_COPC7|nr:3',5'-bisphosphate nucleotidase [Coprinopsis cinerea okayama7\|eukprot:XP_002912208.1 3',5'-bisphosphate nucleotidase [Coprinopsis cinerea okayama7\
MSDFSQEEKVAIAAVKRASILTSSVFEKLVKNETLVKGDKSPVTVGDFAAQAVISTILHNAFPNDPIVGEEDASDLRVESGKAMKDRIVALANEALTAPLTQGEDPAWGVGPGKERTADQILEAIDRGNYPGGSTGRMWTIDPIDGTKGFLRGEQYAVCVSLIVDAKVQVGVIGCPNLPVDPAEPSKGVGCIFTAVRGKGARQIAFSSSSPGADGATISLSIPQTLELKDLSFLESVEAAHSSHSFNDRVAAILNVQQPPTRMDSQAKYACLARGQGGAYLRMPTGVGYKEKIWDHAPGEILVTEAGGIVTDSRGEPLNFGLGRTLGENYGVIAAAKTIHGEILAAVQKAQNEAKAKV